MFTKGSGPKNVDASTTSDPQSGQITPFLESHPFDLDHYSRTTGLTKAEESQLQALLQKSQIIPASCNSLMGSDHFEGRVATHSVFLKSCLFSQVSSSK